MKPPFLNRNLSYHRGRVGAAGIRSHMGRPDPDDSAFPDTEAPHLTPTLLPPSIHDFPPQQLHPLIQRSLCPFSIRPPQIAKVNGVLGGGSGELVLRQAL